MTLKHISSLEVVGMRRSIISPWLGRNRQGNLGYINSGDEKNTMLIFSTCTYQTCLPRPVADDKPLRRQTSSQSHRDRENRTDMVPRSSQNIPAAFLLSFREILIIRSSRFLSIYSSCFIYMLKYLCVKPISDKYLHIISCITQ